MTLTKKSLLISLSLFVVSCGSISNERTSDASAVSASAQSGRLRRQHHGLVGAPRHHQPPRRAGPPSRLQKVISNL